MTACTRESLVVEAWQQSREYICLSLLHAIGYTGGYLGAIPSRGGWEALRRFFGRRHRSGELAEQCR